MSKPSFSFYRWRYRLLLGWMALLVVAAPLAAGLSSRLRAGGWVYVDSESGRVARQLEATFGWDPNRTDEAVFEDPRSTYADPSFRREVQSRLSRLAAAPGIAHVLSYYDSGDRHLVSADGHTTYALVAYSLSDARIATSIDRFRACLAGRDGMTALLTGASAFAHDIDTESKADLARLEVVTMPVIFVLLVLAFGSAVAALLPVVLGAASVGVVAALLWAIASVMPMSTYALNTTTMLGLGLGIDFSLLLVSRFRDELASAPDVAGAVERTMRSAGRSVLFSSLTMAASLAVVFALSDVMILRSISLAMVLGALVSALAALTLLPALLAILGLRLRRKPACPELGQDPWQRWASVVMRSPWRWTVLATVLLVAASAPALSMRIGFPELGSISSRDPSSQGYALLDRAFGPSAGNPILVTIRTAPGGLWSPRFRSSLEAWIARLSADPRIERVDGWPDSVSRAEFETMSPASALWQPLALLRASRWADLTGKADLTWISIVPKGGDRTPALWQLVRDLRADRAGAERELGGARIAVGGVPGNEVDFTSAIYRRFPLMIAGIALVTFTVLLGSLRSLWLPIKAIAMTCLSATASFGVLTLVFQDGLATGLLGLAAPPGHITTIVPVLLFAVLFGLSTDYEVFLLTRIREAHLDGMSDPEAVASGLARTGRIITAAAGVMVAVFLTFAASGVSVVKELGIGLASGVLLDAIVVRAVLAPATMRLMGRWNWYLPSFGLGSRATSPDPRPSGAP